MTGTDKDASYLGSLVSALAVFGALVGCVGVPIDELRSTPPFLQGRSSQPIDAFTRCLLDVPKIERFRTNGFILVTTMPGGSVDVTFGADQMGSRKNYYLVKISAAGTSTSVSASRAPSNYPLVSETELRDALSKCGLVASS